MSFLRYVVLRHDGCDTPHFDLMIEISPGALLATWRSPDWPITKATTLTKAGDHRRLYLDYEGPLAESRGRVRRVESGVCQIEQIREGIMVISSPAWSRRTIELRHIDEDEWRASV